MRWAMLIGVAGACWLGAAFVRGGPEAGPTAWRTELRPFGFWSIALPCKGGERAHIIVAGHLETDVDVYVYDEHGNLVAWDDSALSAGAVEWVPERPARFAIEVRNSGPSPDVVEIQAR